MCNLEHKRWVEFAMFQCVYARIRGYRRTFWVVPLFISLMSQQPFPSANFRLHRPTRYLETAGSMTDGRLHIDMLL